MVTAALSNRLNPSIGRIRCFTRRWARSTRLFKYWLDRTFTRGGSSPASFISRTARCDAVQRDLAGRAPVLHCIAEKGLGSVHITASAQEEIHRLSWPCPQPDTGRPTCPNLYIGLVHPPGSTHRTSISTPGFSNSG